jgi:hypothetical protein
MLVEGVSDHRHQRLARRIGKAQSNPDAASPLSSKETEAIATMSVAKRRREPSLTPLPRCATCRETQRAATQECRQKQMLPNGQLLFALTLVSHVSWTLCSLSA